MITYERIITDIAKYRLVCGISYKTISDNFDDVNGCGAKDSFFKAPDTIWGIFVASVCGIHDVKWKVAKCYKDLVDANNEAEINFKKICDYESITFIRKWGARARIFWYMGLIRLFGTKSYAKKRGFTKE